MRRSIINQFRVGLFIIVSAVAIASIIIEINLETDYHIPWLVLLWPFIMFLLGLVSLTFNFLAHKAISKQPPKQKSGFRQRLEQKLKESQK